MPDLPELRAAKRSALETLRGLRGFVGVGIGDGRILVYVADREAARTLPVAIGDVSIEAIVTGEVRALDTAKDSDKPVQREKKDGPRPRRPAG